MIESDAFSPFDLGAFDPGAFGSTDPLSADPLSDDFGPVELDDPTIDLDGDGISDTVTENTESGLSIATDTDADGLVDQVTIIARTGEYAGWRYHHDECGGRWERTAGGTIGS